MFKNYLKIALRNLLKYKGYSTINILGLAIGMACCIIILLYVIDELSFDRYHERAANIYRVTIESFNEDGATNRHWASISPAIGPSLLNNFPDIVQSVRFWMWSNPIVSYGDKHFLEERFFFVEPSVFEIFTFPLLKGDPRTALSEPDNVVLTEEMAQKYFGDEDPIGKTLLFQERSIEQQLKATGILKDIPRNSHFTFDFLVPFSNWERMLNGEGMDMLEGNYNYATYILLPDGHDPAELEKQFPNFISTHLAEKEGRKPSQRFKIHLQPLTDIHLHSHLTLEIEPNGDVTYVYIFSAIALLILIIACINFMNLATARFARRSKEVGMRKVMGAHRSQIIKQFFGESVFMSFIALSLAIVIVELLLPRFNSFVGKELELIYIESIWLIISLLGIGLFMGLIAGSYPAFFLSRFQPIGVLKGIEKTSYGSSFFRAGLVVFQFAISIALIINMGIVKAQLHYVRNKQLGFNKEQVVVLPASSRMIQQLESIKYQLKQHPGIVNVSASSRVPSGHLLDAMSARVYQGGESNPIGFRLPFVRVDHDFFDTYEMEIVTGRDFLKELSSDSTESFILNETAIREIGWKSPEEAIGKQFGYGREDGRIIGVVKDFHFESMHNQIVPMVFYISPFLGRISVRIQPNDVPGTIAFLKNKWQEYRPGYPFSYFFLNEKFDQLYGSEQRLGQIFGIFSLIAIFIACLGLFSLASFTAEQRTKEIGIRKVLGAKVPGIVALLSKEFVKLVIIANAISWPVAWYAMNKWLQGFAYRTDIELWTFILAGISALVIALLTVSFQAIKAALANPVESLRYE